MTEKEKEAAIRKGYIITGYQALLRCLTDPRIYPIFQAYCIRREQQQKNRIRKRKK